MTHSSPDTDRYQTLVARLATTLDLEAGLADAVLPARHAALAQYTSRILDVEAGLRAIVANRAPTLAPPASSRRPVNIVPVMVTVIAWIGLALVLATLPGQALLTHPPAARVVGYYRVAQFSPDVELVDVFISKVGDPTFSTRVIRQVSYASMSTYSDLPAGTYVVAMRRPGDTGPPVITTQFTVQAGQSYTIAGVGRHANLGLIVFVDDLARPTDGQAKLRVINASIASGGIAVTVDGRPRGQPIAFAATTQYEEVHPGEVRIVATPVGSSGRRVVLTVSLAAGNVYSLLLVDGPAGLALQLRADVHGPAGIPDGGVETTS